MANLTNTAAVCPGPLPFFAWGFFIANVWLVQFTAVFLNVRAMVFLLIVTVSKNGVYQCGIQPEYVCSWEGSCTRSPSWLVGGLSCIFLSLPHPSPRHEMVPVDWLPAAPSTC